MRYELRTADGQSLGTMNFNATAWKPGDTIPLAAGRWYEVLEAPEDEAVLVVAERRKGAV